MKQKTGLTDFVTYLYSVSSEMPQGITFPERVIRAEKKHGKFTDKEVASAKTEYFSTNPQAETFWSLVELRANINASVREKEASGENQSYKVKIENALKQAALDAEIERREGLLFKNDTDARDAFVAGKRRAIKEIGTFEENIGVLKNGSQGR